MIRDLNIPAFLRRLSDKVFEGRNRTRIVLGTDRKQSQDSGWGDGGENDLESGTIDLVAGFTETNPNYQLDKSRVYISGKTNADEYFGVTQGDKSEGEPAVVSSSENVYLLAEKKIKIIIPQGYIILSDGNLEINFTGDINLKSGQAEITMSQDGSVSIGGSGISKRIITEDDICVGTAPSGGGPVSCGFKVPPASGTPPIIFNTKVTIK